MGRRQVDELNRLTANHRIVFLDCLRGVACLLVVFGHVALVGVNDYSMVSMWLPFVKGPIFGPQSPGQNPFNSITTRLVLEDGISVGPLGVSIFFLISGFVILRAIDRESAAVFVVRRFYRIVPLCLFVSIAVALLTTLVCRHQDVASPDSVASVIATGFAMNGIFGTFSTIPVIWSLSVEVFFYSMIAVTACIRPGIGFRRLTFLAFICCCGATLSQVPAIQADLPVWLAGPVIHLGFCAFHTTYMLVGSAMYRFQSRQKSAQTAVALLGIIAIFAATFWFNHVLSGGARTGTTWQIALVAFLVFLAKDLQPREHIVAPLRFFGNISYPLYLVHIPLAWLCMYWSAQLGASAGTGTAAAILIVVLVAWLLHLSIEQRAIAAGKRVSRSVALWQEQQAVAPSRKMLV